MSANETLCCCEYQNRQGERSHLLACCCDCEAFDQIADRCLKCEAVPSSLIDRFLDTLTDRCRFPGIAGGGAIKINFELATPIFVIPTSLMVASIGPIMTAIVLCLLPCFCVFFYHTWKRRTNKARTKFFFVWGLTSVVFMYFLFEMIICSHTRVSYLDNLLISVMVIGMCVALRLAKKDPGIIPDNKVEQYLQDSYAFFGLYSGNRQMLDEDLDDFEVVQIEDFDHSKPEGIQINNGPSLTKGSNWCESCSITKPPRAGHCKVCDVCIASRDHHCVWIDSCIGANNHRSFLVAMVLFILTSYYGSYITLCSVCDPAWPHHISCSYYTAYRDFKWGLCYASAWYTILVASFMLFGLVHQCLLISQNSTSQEVHTANQEGNSKWFIYRMANPHNHGIVQNWIDFVFKQRSVKVYETV